MPLARCCELVSNTNGHRLSRRAFLQVGALGLGGLTLPKLLSAESASGIRSSQKSVILIYLVGGPPHQDMFDLKPDAPKEIAGPWRPIATSVTGIKICEAFPLLAKSMDKLAIVRSLVGNQVEHDAVQVFNGHKPSKPSSAEHFPQFGSVVSKLLGCANPATPPFISLCYTVHPRSLQRARSWLPWKLARVVPPHGAVPKRHDVKRHLTRATWRS